MPLLKKVSAIAAFLLFLPGAVLSSNIKDSAKKVIADIDRAYTGGRITKKVYLDSVYGKMRSFLSANIFFTNKEAVELLGFYRKTIWEDDKAYEQKRNYYATLSNLAHLTNRMGEKLYYIEKIEKLERTAYNDRPSVSALSALAGYYEVTRSPEKIIALYEKSKSYIDKIPRLAEKEPIKEKDLGQAVFFLHFTAGAYYELKQIVNGQAVETLMQQIAGVAKEKYGQDNNLMGNIAHAQILTAIKGASAKNDIRKQWKAIQQIEALRNNAATPEYLQNYIDIGLNYWKLDYFFKQHSHDSVSRYLGIYRHIVESGKKPYELFEYQTYKAKELYNLGRFKESADTLNKAIRTLDSSRSIIVQDVDDLLYAQAEAEEKQLLLDEAEVKQKEAERKLMLAAVILGVLLLAGIFIIRFLRHRQQAKFLKFKFNLARNIHDEANPALLYARALARSQSIGIEGQKGELEKHIDHTMALIRSLSHDLRSDKQYTIFSLVESVEQLLQKLNADSGFTFIIDKPSDNKRFISHYQYAELKAILNECITNTIKHAEFNRIEIGFVQHNNRLTIVYKDNGRGWDAGKKVEGIGIKNIEERSKNLNGDFVIQNQYPNGYFIQVSVLLR